MENLESLYGMNLEDLAWQPYFSSLKLCTIMSYIVYFTEICNTILNFNLFPLKYFVKEIVFLKMYSEY